MKRMLGTVSLFLGVAACDIATAPQAFLDLEVSLSSTRLVQDSGMVVTVTATNRTNRTLHLETLGGCLAFFELRAPDDAPLPTSVGYGCRSILVEHEVVPGESLTQRFPLWIYVGRDGVRWPQGEYELVAYLVDKDLNRLKATAPVRFDVVCRDPSWSHC